MRARPLIISLLAAAALAGALVLAVTWGRFHAWLEDTAPLAEWGVALGTAALATATYRLARRAHEEAQAVARQVEIEAEQLVAAQRPVVLPIMGVDTVAETRGDCVGIGGNGGPPHLELRNAGAGPAMNVRGSLWWSGTAGGSAALHPQVLAAGDDAWARVVAEGAVVNWRNAVGYLRYHDLSGSEWQTHFRFRVDGAGNRRVEVVAVGPTGEFGEPAYNSEGWVNQPEHVQLWRVVT